MEVMLEIYRTLKTLKMEWKAKPCDSAADSQCDDGDEGAAKERERERAEETEKQRRRREEEERIKKAQELYFVETRCRMDDVMVSRTTVLHDRYRCDSWTVLTVLFFLFVSGSNGPPAVSDRRPELPRRFP